MDDFLEYVTANAHSSMSSTLDVSSTGLEPSVKQESYDSKVWIQGFSDSNFVQQSTFQSTAKTSFLQSTNYHNPIGFDSLLPDPLDSLTPPIITNPLDPLEFILNQPPADPVQSLTSTAPATTVQNITPAVVKTEPSSDAELMYVLGASSSHNTTGKQVKSEPLCTFNSSQLVEVEAVKSSPVANLKQQTLMPLSGQQSVKTPEPAPEVLKEINPKKDLNLAITNVVTSFRVRCHLNLRRIAQEGINVIYQKESKKIVMRIRNPKCTAYVWSSGKIICTGANSESAAKKASRKFAKRLQNIGFQVIFSNYKVINVLAVCRMPYHIDIVDFSEYHRSKHLSYEPEIHPAVTYRMPEFKVTFKIFSTGAITLTCPVVARIPEAIKKVYPMVKDFFKLDKPNDLSSYRNYRPEESDEDDNDHVES